MCTGEESVSRCFDCARRMGLWVFADVPEMLDGVCPQCGGSDAVTSESQLDRQLVAPRAGSIFVQRNGKPAA